MGKKSTRKRKKAGSGNGSGANLGFEAILWQAADKLRGHMDAAEYKHVVLGLIFLKYISDAFEEKHAQLQAEVDQGADPEDPDEYRAINVFWVPKEARWSHLQDNAKQPTIGKLIDDAMVAIERDASRGLGRPIRDSSPGRSRLLPAGESFPYRSPENLIAVFPWATLQPDNGAPRWQSP
jgi:type I restriction-modification system DNA methylase subunit